MLLLLLWINIPKYNFIYESQEIYEINIQLY